MKESFRPNVCSGDGRRFRSRLVLGPRRVGLTSAAMTGTEPEPSNECGQQMTVKFAGDVIYLAGRFGRALIRHSGFGPPVAYNLPTLKTSTSTKHTANFQLALSATFLTSSLFLNAASYTNSPRQSSAEVTLAFSFFRC